MDVSKEFSDHREIFLKECPICDLKFFYPLAPGSEFFYKDLQQFDWYYLEEKNEYSIAKNFIKKSDSVLDVGSGKGAFKEFVNGADFTGLELSNEAIITGQQKNIKILNQTIEEHASANKEKYDVVCAFQVLEHIPNIHTFIEKCLDALKPQGLLIISVPSDESFVPRIFNCILNMPPHHISRWPDSTLKKVAKQFNLSVHHFEHDLLSPIHKDVYSMTVCHHALNKIFNRKERLINRSLLDNILKKLSYPLSLFYSKGLVKGLLPLGHSITVVYKKMDK